MGFADQVFRPWRNTPRASLNWTLFWAVWTFGFCGAMGGMDDGSIAGVIVQQSYITRFGLSTQDHSAADLANIKGNIISLSQIGGIPGSLLIFPALEQLGRKRALQIACITNVVVGFFSIVGIIIQITAKSGVGQIYGGRIILGFAGGMASVIGPTYLAEIAPKSIRGACGIFHGMSIYIGIVIGYFANYGTAIHISNTSDAQWQIPLSLALIFPVMMFSLSFWAPESPRWLIQQGRESDAHRVFTRLRRLPEEDPYIIAELTGVHEQLERERAMTEGSGFWGPLKELLFVPDMRYRLLLAFGLGAAGQWAGGGAFTAFAPELFALVGITGNTGLFTTGIYGIVKLVSSFICAFFVVDRLGRKTALFAGISLQIFCSLYLAVYLQTTNNVAQSDLSSEQQHAGTGAVAMIFLSGLSWALGWNAIQHPINAELFPLRLRAMGVSIAVCFRSLMNFGATKALPSMLVGIQGYGTYYFFFAEGIVAIAFVWFFLPETKGRALEELDAIFGLPWYKIGRIGRLYADDQGLGLVTVPEGDHVSGGHSGLDDRKGSDTQLEKV